MAAWRRCGKSLLIHDGLTLRETAEFRCLSQFHFKAYVHGVLLLAYDHIIGRKVILWNPSIRKYTAINNWDGIRYLRFSHVRFGFGFDGSSNDYKVLAVFTVSVVCLQIWNLGSETPTK